MQTSALGEISKIKSGCPVSKLVTNTDQKGLEAKIVTIKDVDVNDASLDCEKIESVWLEDIDAVNKYRIKPGQVLITAKGQSIRATPFVASLTPALAHTNLFVITDISPVIIPEYLALYLSLEPVVEEMKENLVGTTIFSLTKKDLEKLQIRIPPLDVQKKLVALAESGKQLMTARKLEVENIGLLMKQTLINRIMVGN
jgi:hypothetical protein